MSSEHPPLTCSDVKRVLKKLGFEKVDGKASSHEKWTRTTEQTRYVVTVDCPKAPFSPILIHSMARQAGMTKKQFYEVYRGL